MGPPTTSVPASMPPTPASPASVQPSAPVSPATASAERMKGASRSSPRRHRPAQNAGRQAERHAGRPEAEVPDRADEERQGQRDAATAEARQNAASRRTACEREPDRERQERGHERAGDIDRPPASESRRPRCKDEGSEAQRPAKAAPFVGVPRPRLQDRGLGRVDRFLSQTHGVPSRRGGSATALARPACGTWRSLPCRRPRSSGWSGRRAAGACPAPPRRQRAGRARWRPLPARSTPMLEAAQSLPRPLARAHSRRRARARRRVLHSQAAIPSAHGSGSRAGSYSLARANTLSRAACAASSPSASPEKRTANARICGQRSAKARPKAARSPSARRPIRRCNSARSPCSTTPASRDCGSRLSVRERAIVARNRAMRPHHRRRRPRCNGQHERCDQRNQLRFHDGLRLRQRPARSLHPF